MNANSKSKINIMPSMTGVIVLCLIAISAQSMGLVSIVKYVTTREGWEAQKEQYSAVTSEWEAMSASTRSKIDKQRLDELEIEQDRVAADKELEYVLKKLATSKGELDSIESAVASALELQRRSQSEEQASLDSVQKLKGELSELGKQKATIQNQLDTYSKQLEAMQSRVATNQSTLDRQESELKANTQKITQVDTVLKTVRENLRNANDELLSTNVDLMEAIKAKKETTAATESAIIMAKDVENLKSEKAKLGGELLALSMQKQELEKEIATADTRMGVARTKLAEYLDKWNNKDKITQEIDGLIAKVNTLKQSESDTSGSIVRLTEQAVKLETKSKVLTDEINTAELQLSELKNKQKQLLAELIELQKVKKETENSNGTNSATVGSASAGKK